MFAPPVNREVKAQDVVDSWDFNSDPNLGTNYTVFVMAAIEGTDDSGFREGKTISGLKVIDDYTLQVTLKQPFYDFPVTLGHPIMYVQPVEYIKQVGVKKYALKPEGGTGPVHDQGMEVRAVHRPGQEPGLVALGGPGRRSVPRRHPHAAVPEREQRVARLPDGHHRLGGRSAGTGRRGAEQRPR